MNGGTFLDQADRQDVNSFLLSITRQITQRVPGLFWHYTTAEGFLGIVASKKLRASHITAMNDAYEYRYGANSLAQAISFRLNGQSGISADSRSMLECMHRSLSSVTLPNVPPVFVSCFTSDVDQTNHWGEYGDRGKGYALGFRAPDAVQIANEQQIFLLPCVYDDRTVAGIMKSAVANAESVFAQVRRKNANTPITELIDDFLEFYFWNLAFLAPAFKSPTFAHESEWRYTMHLPVGDLSRLTFVAKKSEIRPYIDFDFVTKTPPTTGLTPLHTVVIGPARYDIDQELALLSVRALLDKCGYGRVQVQRSRSPYRGA
jgi:hypothetical protein